jgi:phage protein D
MLPLKITPKIIYNKKDISKDLASFLTNVSYTDPLSNKADDLTLDLENSLKLWNGDWLPEKGDSLQVSFIYTINGKDTEIPIGTYEVDEIEVSGPPSTASIKAVSIPNNSNLRGVAKNKAWEKVTLSRIATDVANETGMKLVYSADTDPAIERAEITEESYLEFLQKLCDDNGMALKISDGNIAIFEEYKYEQEEPVGEIDLNITRIINYRFTSKLRDVYKSCHVKYTDTGKGTTIEATFTDPNKTVGQTLEINKQVTSYAEAERLARQELRNKNKEEITAEINLDTTTFYYAGQVLTLKNFKKFDGKYIITNVDCSVGSEVTARLSLRRCLNGY